jgi:CBS domain-containing protein
VRNVVTAQPNETLRAAARRMSRLGLRQLPVVAGDSADSPPLGLLRRSDILAAYERSLEEPTPIGG